MGDVDLVWVRGYSVNGREVLTLARESAPTKWLTAADVREILGDEPPVIAYDDSGPGGAIIFPDRHDVVSGQIASMLSEQLRTAIRRRALARPCPAESFPEPGAPDVADDFAEPAGGEAARVAAEESAHEAALRAAAVRSSDLIYDHWRPGERFVVAPDGDPVLCHVGVRLWVYACNKSGRVIDRVRLHTGLGLGDPALLVQVEGLTERVVVGVGVLSACAKKVTA